MSDRREAPRYSVLGAPQDFPLAREYPVELIVDGTRANVFLCTPEHQDELAAGFLFSRGVLRDPDEIRTLDILEDGRRVLMTTSLPLKGAARVPAGDSGSVRGPDSAFAAQFEDAAPVESDLTVRLETLKRWAREMFAAAVQYRETGGMHCARLADEDGRLCVREDVGRHNTVDKVLGRCFLDRRDFSRACLLTSGRIAADMILKALAARVPVVVTRSIPTTTAYEIAASKGISLVGRIESDKPILYTVPERILR